MALAVFLFLGLYRKRCLGSQRGWFRLNPIKPAANHSSGSLSSGQHLWIGREAAAAAKSLQSCPTLCDPIDGSPPGSPVPGILQARTLEWVAISFSKQGRLLITGLLGKHGLFFKNGNILTGSCMRKPLGRWCYLQESYLRPSPNHPTSVIA